MTKKEAYDIMMKYTWTIGSVGVEEWSDKDGNKMRECLNVLMYGEIEEVE